MPGPDLDDDGMLIKPPLKSFDRFIEQGMSCIVKLVIDETRQGGEHKAIQFSLTLAQCKEIAANLAICAQVIELERPSQAQ